MYEYCEIKGFRFILEALRQAEEKRDFFLTDNPSSLQTQQSFEV